MKAKEMLRWTCCTLDRVDTCKSGFCPRLPLPMPDAAVPCPDYCQCLNPGKDYSRPHSHRKRCSSRQRWGELESCGDDAILHGSADGTCSGRWVRRSAFGCFLICWRWHGVSLHGLLGGVGRMTGLAGMVLRRRRECVYCMYLDIYGCMYIVKYLYFIVCSIFKIQDALGTYVG